MEASWSLDVAAAHSAALPKLRPSPGFGGANFLVLVLDFSAFDYEDEEEDEDD